MFLTDDAVPKCTLMDPTISSSNADLYRRRASEMRNAASQAKNEEIFRLYSHAAKQWEDLAEMAEESMRYETLSPRKDDQDILQSPDGARIS